jgi:hypothetical protein
LRYTTLEQAVAASISGDTVKVAPGTYVIPAGTAGNTAPGMTAYGRDFEGIDLETFTLEWEVPGVRPVIDLSAYAYDQGSRGGRTIGLNVGPNNRTFTVRGLTLIGDPRRGDPYGINSNQGYRSNADPPATLNIEYCELIRWADGVKNTIDNRNLTTSIKYSVIEDCTGNDLTHGVCVNGALLEVIGSKFITTLNRIMVNHGSAPVFAVGTVFVGASGNGVAEVVQIVAPNVYAIRKISNNLSVGESLTVGGVVRGTLTSYTRLGMDPPQNNAGHLIKSRARQTIVRGSFFDPLAGCASCIETPSAGDLIVEGNVIFHYGPPSNRDENPAIKYGFEESASRFTLNPVGGPLSVGDIVTGSGNGGTARITHIMSTPNTYVFKKLNSDYIWNGETISVGGVLRGTITSREGSPDGSSNDGRAHRIKVAQNTIRKSQPSWNGGAAYRIGAMWVSQNMTLDNGTPLPQSAVPITFRNNIVGGTECGGITIQQFPDNTAVLTGQINDQGIHLGGVVSGNPAINDATLSFAGAFTMPTTRTDTNRGGLATVLSSMPAWRAAVAANTWVVVSPSSIREVNPQNNPALNPNYPNEAPWRGSDGQKSVIDAWGSAAWDEANRKLWIPIGGGHGNYAGNECYMQPLGDNSPNWVMPRPPSGAIGNQINLYDGQEITSVYADGRPRSVHPYSNICYADGVGPVIARISAPFANSNISTHRVFCLDPVTGESRLVFNFADPAQTGFPSGTAYGTGTGGALGSACCYDSLRNRVVSVGIGDVYPLWCTPTATPGMWSGGHLPTRSLFSGGSIQHMLYIPTIDRYLLLVHYLGTIYHKLIHPVTGVMTDLGAVAGALPSGYLAADGDGPSGVWCGDLNVVGVYMQGSNTTQILKLTPPGDLTSKWVASTFAVSSSNTVIPLRCAEHSGGGMFQYSSSLKGFIHIPTYPSPTHFFAIS